MRLRNIPRAESTLAASPFVLEKKEELMGAWSSIFQNSNPIHIEIGMGKGQFLTEMARKHPHINYVGIERYSSVLLRAVEKLSTPSFLEHPPSNLRFLCMDAFELPEIFQPEEVQAIYLNFSDPWPKARHAKRRLTASPFLSIYHQILTTDGRLEFKTDNRPLFDFSKEEIHSSPLFSLLAFTYDLHQDSNLNSGNIMTEYEEKFSSKGNPICKLICQKVSF